MLTAPELNERLRSGNRDALFSLMSFYYNDLFRFGIRFTADKELTKDIIGQFFLHVWDHRDQFAKANNTRSYLFVAYRRFIIYYLNQISRQLNISDPGREPVEYSYEEYLIAWQQKENIRRLLSVIIQSLPDRQRELVQLRFYEQMSFEEIAEHTSLSVRTVYNKLHEALKRIRSHALSEYIKRDL